MVGLRRLDALVAALDYLSLTTAMMRQATVLWADARRQGRPTADDKALDGDVILAAQVILATTANDEAIVATENVGHLARFVTAYPWWDIHEYTCSRKASHRAKARPTEEDRRL